MAQTRKNRKGGRRSTAKKGKVSMAKPAFAAKVLSVVKRTQETKYVGDNIYLNQPVFSSQATPATLYRILPRVENGTAEDQRVGDRIQPIKARCFLHVRLSATANLFDATVNVIFLAVKGAATAAAVAAIPNDQLLKVGDGGNTDPTIADQSVMLTQVNHYPVNTDQYTVLKRTSFRMAKGPGALNGAPGTAAESGPPAQTPTNRVIKYTWTPPVLKYNLETDTMPQNHYPVFIIWATSNDANALQGDILKYSVRSDMFYKDA